MTSYGQKCSIHGKQYEQHVLYICKKYGSPLLRDVQLSTQHVDELGGCSSRKDITLNYRHMNDIGVEVKRPSPDWIQFSIYPNPDKDTCGWTATRRASIPVSVQAMFLRYIDEMKFPVPPFFTASITRDEWIYVQTKYKDRYQRVPDNCIAMAYNAKGCHYIQVKEYGLYHTGEDVCTFGVPMFLCEQYIRVRCKRHGKKDVNGKHVPSSVMMSFRPKMKTLTKSPYSLDDDNTMPANLCKYVASAK